ncbi:hypothetical protein PHYPSEUDO_015168 [Phytophthora pseudosyringae]|uniref:Uncharacterized protein n=1 Tax=Phytophthora pseudosyringae TaxID=221518 RepID=A0A8T1W2S2_9STRA|nr:hypothetical protein PHYPSEUDO_015168 [Phytophthora pseudosyringae]
MRGQLELTPTYAAQLDGKILANAHAVGDVDGDGATELLFGSLLGKVSVFKIMGDRLTQWRSCEVNGSVTSICLDYSVAGDVGAACCGGGGGYYRTRVIVATAEGKCSVFRSVEGAGVLQLCSEFNAALNICDVVHLNGELIVATRDGRVLVYRANVDHADPDELAEFSQVAQMEINGEIETLIVLQSASANPDASPRLLARCFSGEVFCVSDKRDVVPWDGPPNENDGITFVVGDIELGGERGMNALVSMSGLVSLFSSSGERQWDFQLPEAVVNADKLEMTAVGGDRQDAIVVCTWSGQLYAIQSERRLVRFRMLLPGCSMFCGKLLSLLTTVEFAPSTDTDISVLGIVDIRDLSAQVDPTIVCISTSGTIFVYRDVQETLIRGLQDSTLSDKVRESAVFAQMDTPEKRQELMRKLRKAFPRSVVSSYTATPSTEELIQAMLAVQMDRKENQCV